MFLEKLFGRRRSPSSPSPHESVAFTLQWSPASPDRCGRLRSAAVLATDVAPIGARDLRDMRRASGALATPLVVAAPAFEPECLPAAAGLNIFPVLAADVGVQPADDLLSDLAVLTGGKPMFSALGVGLSAPAAPKSPSGLIVPGMPWSAVAPADLGKAAAVEISETQAVVHAACSREVDAHLRALLGQFRSTLDDRERESIARRFVRFGRTPEHADRIREDQEPASADRSAGGLASPFFVTDPVRMAADLAHPRILVLGFDLADMRDGMAVGERLLGRADRPTVVVAPAIAGPALALLVVNKLAGILAVAAIQPAPTPSSAEALTRVAELTGSRCIESPEMLASLRDADFGRAARVVATRRWFAVRVP